MRYDNDFDVLFIDYDLMMHAVLAIVLAESENRISIQAGRDEPSRYLDLFCSNSD